MRTMGPVTEEQLLAAEAKIGATLPRDYRTFVAEHGAATSGSTEIYGLTRADRLPNVLWCIHTLAADGFLTVPVLLPISPVGDGSYVALLLRPTGALPAGAAVYWDPDRRGAVDGIQGLAASDFATWLSGRQA